MINYFGPQMYTALGVRGDKLLLVQGIYGAVGPITNLVFIVFVLDRIGRKKPLLFGAASLTVLFSILAAIVASFPPSTSSAGGETNLGAQKAGIAIIFAMSIIFSLSFGPVSWVLASEIFPTRTRGMGVAVATCCNWLLNVVISEVSPIGMGHVGWKYVLSPSHSFVWCLLSTDGCLGIISCSSRSMRLISYSSCSYFPRRKVRPLPYHLVV